MLATIPMVAYALEISLLQAILIDLLMTLRFCSIPLFFNIVMTILKRNWVMPRNIQSDKALVAN